jgi:hypothetical protein
MSNQAKDYRKVIGYEELYELNILGTIRALDVQVYCRGVLVSLKDTPVIIKKAGRVKYAIIKDKNFKNRKINITLMVKNLFGRQRAIVPKQPKILKDFVKPVNKRGRAGIPVDQYDDGKIVGTFATFAAAAKAVCGVSTGISDAAYGKRKMYAGYKWKINNNKK